VGHLDAVHGGTLFATAAGFRGHRGDPLEHVIAIDQGAKSGVLFGEERGTTVKDEEMTPRGVGI